MTWTRKTLCLNPWVRNRKRERESKGGKERERARVGGRESDGKRERERE